MEDRLIGEERLDNRKVIMRTFYDETIDWEYKKILLPEITDIELLERYKRIKPIIKVEDIYYKLREFNIGELRNCSYLGGVDRNVRECVDMNAASVVGEFSCYHSYGYFGFFKPSIGEVLSQFPDEMLDVANAFYLYQAPKNADDLNKQIDIVDAGCHKSKVRALIFKK